MERHRPEPRSDGPDEPEQLWVDKYLLPAMRDPGLLPIVIVVAGHIVAFLTPAMVFAVRDRSLGSALALLILGFLSAEVARFELGRKRTPTLTRFLAGTWVAAVGAAFAAHRYGVL